MVLKVFTVIWAPISVVLEEACPNTKSQKANLPALRQCFDKLSNQLSDHGRQVPNYKIPIPGTLYSLCHYKEDGRHSP